MTKPADWRAFSLYLLVVVLLLVLRFLHLPGILGLLDLLGVSVEVFFDQAPVCISAISPLLWLPRVHHAAVIPC